MTCLNPLLKTQLSDRVSTARTRVLFLSSAVSGNYRKEQDASLQFLGKIQNSQDIHYSTKWEEFGFISIILK